MPQGSKKKYTEKQKRKAEHIEESYEKRGVQKDEAEKRAWRTVNKQDGGGKKKSGGAKKSAPRSSSRGAKKTTRKSSGTKKNAR